MDVSGISGSAYPTHPFIDPRSLDGPRAAVGANAGTAFVKPQTQSTGTAFVTPNAVPPMKDLGRMVDLKL